MKKYLVFFALVFGMLFLYARQLGDLLQGANDSYARNYYTGLSDIYNCNFDQHNESIPLSGIREKAHIMGSVEWTPKHSVPNNSGSFVKGIKVKGLPYSSVKELQKFIGLDVSIYTFLTAVNNPYSLLYTENVAAGKPCYLGGKYNGKNSHTFYGTVCSSFTAYCYGENNNYASFNYRNGEVPNYYLKKDQSIDGISSGDLFWCPGHVALITYVEKDSLGRVRKIEMFESAGIKVYSKSYTPSSFARRMSGNGDLKNKAYLYRNKLVDTSISDNHELVKDYDLRSLFDNLGIENNEICTWFGDKPCIGEWDKLVINFNKKDFDRILIALNDEFVDTLDISNKEHSIEYKYGKPGIYKAQLASDSIVSAKYTSFEVIDTSTKIINNEDGTVEVLFAEHSNPEIVYWVNKAGDQYTFPTTVSDSAKKVGKMTLQPWSKKDTMLRVIYRGKYGRAINKPHHLF